LSNVHVERQTLRTYAAGRRPGLSQWSTSLATRFALGTVLLIVAVTALVVSELTRLEWRRLLDAKRSAATMMAGVFSSSLEAALDFGDLKSIKSHVDGLQSTREILHAQVLASDQSEVIAEFRRSETVECSSEDCVEVIEPVVNPAGQELGSVLIRVSLAREKEAFGRTRTRLVLLGSIISFGLATVLVLVARRVLVTPLGRLEAAAEGLATGAMVEVPVLREDELGRLTRTFNAMAHTIHERERRIAASNARLQSLLDNMGDAIVVFGSDGVLTEEHSRQAERVFGATTATRIIDLLFPIGSASEMEREAFSAWVEVAFATGAEQFSQLQELAPRTACVQREEQSLELELEWRLVSRAQQPDQIMLLARDVTEKKRLERSVAQKELEHEAQISAVRRLVGGGGQLFAGFIESAHQRLASCKELTDASGPLPPATIESLFQQFHTLRAEARCFDLVQIEAHVRKLEELLGEFRKGGTKRTAVERTALSTGIGELAGLLGEAEQTFVEQSPLGAAALDQITVRRSRFLGLLDCSKSLQGPAKAKIEELAARPLVESIALLPEAVARWAEHAGKSVSFEVDHRGVEIPFELSRVLGGVLSHLLRNAIAHGIETESERHAANKSGTGAIRIAAERRPDGVVISVADDGRGFDLEAISKRAHALGIDDGSSFNMAFESGISTAAEHGELSGAGVGLAAARAELHSVGYRIQIVSTSPLGTELRLTPRDTAIQRRVENKWPKLEKSC
jgi:two-component system chemotaxis sensor kinase CheA